MCSLIIKYSVSSKILRAAGGFTFHSVKLVNIQTRQYFIAREIKRSSTAPQDSYPDPAGGACAPRRREHAGRGCTRHINRCGPARPPPCTPCTPPGPRGTAATVKSVLHPLPLCVVGRAVYLPPPPLMDIHLKAPVLSLPTVALGLGLNSFLFCYFAELN